MRSKIHHAGRISSRLTKQSLQRGNQWFWARLREAFECRSCDRQVGAFETTCPHCGSANPAKISLNPLAIGGGLGIFSVVSWYCFF